MEKENNTNTNYLKSSHNEYENGTNNLLLSIVIPVYNTEKLLPECLASILEQDFDKSRYEIICVDDGSPDNAGKILDEYAEKYSNIKVIHKENGGLASARYVGINHASGRYAWFVDSDDFIDTDSFNIIEKALIENDYPEHLHFWFISTPWDGNESREQLLKKKNTFKTTHNEATIWTSVYSRELLVKYKIPDMYFKKDISFSEDTLFNFYISCFEKSSARIKDALYYYRDNPKSMTSQRSIKKEKKRARDYIMVASSMKKVLDDFDSKKYNCSKSYVAYFFINRVWILMEMLACLPINYGLKFLLYAKREKVFPVKMPEDYDVSPENTLKWAYGKTKTEKYLNCHCHTRFGFLLMYIYYTPIRIKTVLKRLLKK